MQYLANKHGLDQYYPTDPGKRAMTDSAMFYLTGTFYPLVVARHLPGARLPAVPGRGRDLGRRRRRQGEGAAGRERRAGEPLEAFHTFFMDGKQFIGGDSPSIADIRLAVTLEFLDAIDYDFPGWAKEYLAAVEAALGNAYTEPASDVREFVASVKP